MLITNICIYLFFIEGSATYQIYLYINITIPVDKSKINYLTHTTWNSKTLSIDCIFESLFCSIKIFLFLF